jgi:hypothetical protein
MAEFLGKNVPLLTRAIAFANGAGVSFVTLTGAQTVTLKSPQVSFTDPGGASRNVTYPDTKGAAMFWLVLNTADAAENLVLKDPAGTTLVTVNQDEGGFVATDGTTWDAVSFAIALA